MQDKRAAVQQIPAAGRLLEGLGGICRPGGPVEAVVDSTCEQGAPCLHCSPVCGFVGLPGGGCCELPPVLCCLMSVAGCRQLCKNTASSANLLSRTSGPLTMEWMRSAKPYGRFLWTWGWSLEGNRY